MSTFRPAQRPTWLMVAGLWLIIAGSGCIIADEADCTSDDDCASGEQCARGGGLFVRDGVCVADAFGADVGPSQDADPCPGDEMLCDGVCVDVTSDLSHCGECGNDCHFASAGADPVCDDGICSFECIDENEEACRGECVDVTTDYDHCGSCGNSCAIDGGTATCEMGECTVEECDDDFIDCSEETPDGAPVCADLDAHPEHCGECGRDCGDILDIPDNAIALCDEGECDWVCDEGYWDCAGECALEQGNFDVCDGECVDLDATHEHCGGCDEGCAPEHACWGGACVEDCPGQYQICDGACVDTTSHLDHCGGCGQGCDDHPDNASPLCTAGSCDWECDSGYFECDGECLDETVYLVCGGECVNVETDPAHCGDCDDTCDNFPDSAVPLCVDGSCEWECDEGFTECEGECIPEDAPCCISDYAGDFGGGEGSHHAPFLLCDPTHIAELDAVSTGQHFLLTADLDLDGVDNALPIGDSDMGFEGEFDGGGNELSNPSVASGGDRTGVFTSLREEGSIKDLVISSLNVVGTDEVGGVAGVNEGTITGVAVEGTITGAEGTGGLVGVNTESGRVADCRADVDVTGTDGVGGLVGINHGTVEGGSEATGDVDGARDVGGLAGIVGSSAVIEESAATGAVFGTNDVGGLVGRIEACISENDDVCNSGHVRRCLAAGDVVSPGRAGGLVARIEGCQIQRNVWVAGGECWSPEVRNSYATGDVEGDEHSGGLIAVIDGCVAEDNLGTTFTPPECRSPLVVETYSAGYVGANLSTSNFGGLVAEINDCNSQAWTTCEDPQISDSYWDLDTSDQSNSAGGQGLTTPDFALPSSFQGWDFTDIWEIVIAPDGVERPVLQWVE